MTTEEPQYHWSQVAAQAMRDELDKKDIEIRRLNSIIGALNREADQQAETIEQLRGDVATWQARYARAAANNRPKG